MKLDSSFVTATDYFLEKLGKRITKLEQNSARQNTDIVGLLNKSNSLIEKINSLGILSSKKVVEEQSLTEDLITFINSPAIHEDRNTTKNFRSQASPTKDFSLLPKEIKLTETLHSDHDKTYTSYAHMNRKVRLEVAKQLQDVQRSVEIKQKSKYSNQESPVKNYRSQKSNQSPNKTYTYYANQRMLNYYKSNPSEP